MENLNNLIQARDKAEHKMALTFVLLILSLIGFIYAIASLNLVASVVLILLSLLFLALNIYYVKRTNKIESRMPKHYRGN